MITPFLRRYLLEVLVCLAIILILLAGLALGNTPMPGANAAPAQHLLACAWMYPSCV